MDRDRIASTIKLKEIYSQIKHYVKGPPWYELSAQSKSFVKNEASKLMDKAQKIANYRHFCKDMEDDDSNAE